MSLDKTFPSFAPLFLTYLWHVIAGINSSTLWIYSAHLSLVIAGCIKECLFVFVHLNICTRKL